MGKLLHGVTIASGGVLPNINPVLLPKKSPASSSSQAEKASSATKSPKKAWLRKYQCSFISDLEEEEHLVFFLGFGLGICVVVPEIFFSLFWLFYVKPWEDD